MAQVTVSGKFAMAYESTNVNTAGTVAKTSGLGVTDGDIVFAASEDLGNGMKASADMAIRVRGRGASTDTYAADTVPDVRGRDAKIVISGGFGSVLIGSIEAGNGIIGLGGAGAPVYGMDGTVIAGAGNTDLIRYTTPTISGFNVYVSALDAVGAAGMQQAATTQDSTQIGINYSAGALKVAADYVTASLNSATIADSATGTQRDSRTRISASYNLGIANVGVGYEVDTRFKSATAKFDITDTIVGVSIPMGAVTLGAAYATSKNERVAGEATVKGYDLGLKYDLSKRTNVAFHYQSVDNRAGTTVGTTSDNSKFRMRVMHSF